MIVDTLETPLFVHYNIILVLLYAYYDTTVVLLLLLRYWADVLRRGCHHCLSVWLSVRYFLHYMHRSSQLAV